MEEAQKLFDRMLRRNEISWVTMIVGYHKNRRPDMALRYFEMMPMRNLEAWNAMISGYTQNKLEAIGLHLFSRMTRDGIKPDQIVFCSVIDACAKLEAFKKAMQVHSMMMKMGFESEVSIGNVLISFYSKFKLDDAWRVFNEMPMQDNISWNAMVTGFIQHGLLVDARNLFNRMPQRNVVSWTAMIDGYAQNDCAEEAFKMYQKMKRQGERPNRYTFGVILSACANFAIPIQGKQIHADIAKTEYCSDMFVQNALVTMYSKCGNIDIACLIFYRMKHRDIVSWTAIISGLAQHGYGWKALEFFENMCEEGISPNHVTFLAILTACSHSHLLEEGWKYFHSMIHDYGIKPEVDHYACMVDLLSRMGMLKEAESLIKGMPVSPDPVVWKALLNGCAIHQNLDIGERAAKTLFRLEPNSSATYVLLSNIYAAAARWDDVNKVGLMMKKMALTREAGCN